MRKPARWRASVGSMPLVAAVRSSWAGRAVPGASQWVATCPRGRCGLVPGVAGFFPGPVTPRCGLKDAAGDRPQGGLQAVQDARHL